MVGSKLGYRARQGLGVGVLVLAAGCSEGADSAGDEGDTINLARCYGVDCGSSPQSTTTGSEAAVGEPCGATAGVLGPAVAFESVGQFLQMVDFEASPDGSFWQLGLTQPQDLNRDFQEPVLIHYSHEGELLGVSEPVQKGSAYSSMEQSLVVDAAGNATVAVYSIYAPTADSELVERLNLYTFAPDLSALGPPVSFRGIGKPHLAGEASGAILVGGNAINNAAHGTLARLEAGEPAWIQTRVPTSGQGAGVGVSDLVVDEAGASAMVSQRSKRWESGADLYTYGVSTFDADGNPGWDLVLPTPYQGGYVAALASNGQGELVVAGYGYGSDEDLLVRSVSPEGELGWAYRVPSGWPNAHVDAQTGRTFVTGWDKVAVIEPGGQLCSYLEVPREEGTLAYSLGDVIVQEPYVYTMTAEGIARYELPEASLATSDLTSE